MILSNRKGTFQLLIIMIFVTLLVTTISIFIVQRVVLNEKKDYLKELSENQISIIQTIYAEGKNANEVLHLLKRQQKFNTTIGKTGEFVIGYLKNDTVSFLLDHLRYDFGNPKPIALNSKLAEPMKFALLGKSGIMKGVDYSNDRVLAYCSYIPELQWGVVTKIDIAEVNEPFYKAGIIASLIAILLVVVATIIFKRISDPIVNKIIESEETFRAILDATQESVYLFNRVGKFIAANQIGSERLNLKPADILGHHFSKFMTPELAVSRQEHLNHVFDSGKPVFFEDMRNGQCFEHHFYPCFKNGEVNYVATYSRDVTEIRKKELELLKLNRMLKALGKSSLAMLKATDEQSYLEEVCRIVAEDCGFAMVWIGYVQHDEAKTVKPVAYAGFEKGYLETLNISWDDNELGRGPTGTAIRTGQPASCPNMLTDPAFEPWRDQALKRGYASSLVLPLLDNNKAFGAITIYSPDPDSYKGEEINFLKELASDLAHGIISIRLKIAGEKAAEELRKSEQRLKYHFENSPLAVVEWDSDFIVTHWSSEAERIFGWNAKETIGKRIDTLNIIYEEDIHIVNRTMERLTSGRENTVISSNRNYTKSQNIIECTWYNSILMDDNGKMSSVMSLIEDITKRKQMNEALKESEKKYRELVKYAPTGIYEIDFRSKKLVTVNDAMCLLSGYSREELLSMNVFDILDPESKDRFQARLSMMLKGEKPEEDIEYKVKAKDGHIIYALLNVNFKVDEHGKPVGAMVVGHDITERKHNEQALQRREEQYRKLVEISPYAVFINRNNRITFVNPAAIKLFGATTTEQLLGKTPFDIFHPNAHSIVKERIEKVLAGKSVPIIEIKILQLDGTERDVEVTGSKFTDQEGDAIQVILRDITENKLAQTINTRYQLITEYARDPLLLVGVNGEIVEANHAAEEFYGYSHDELVKLKIHSLREDKEGLINKQIMQSRQKGILFETLHIRKDGSKVPVEVSSRGVMIDGQEMILSVIRDNTERKKTEQALVEQAKMLEQAPVLVRNLNDEIIVWNSGMEKIYGFNSAEAIGKISHELLQTQYPEPAQDIFAKLYEHGKWEGELQHKQKDGQPAVVLSSWILHHNEQGNPTAIIEVNKDITKRKKAENALQESEEKLNLAMENGSIGVWVWDIATNEIEWDERMERMFGLKPGSFGKSYEAFEASLLEEDIPHVRNAIKKAMEKDIPFETIYRIKLGHGNPKYISAKALVKKDQEGKPVKMTGVCFDITEVKKDAEQVLFKLNEELLRSNKELEQFAYVASHDLQEPLRMVSSFTQLLAQRYADKLDQNANEFIQFAVDGASRMQTLINDLLTYSRIQSKGKEFSNVSLHDILGKVMHILNVPIQEKRALITNDELPTIFADEGQMIQLLQNLIGNAIKFSKENPMVHISAIDENDQCTVSVRDNGIGIEKQYFERIFQIFQRLQAKDEYEGTGIGLAICKRIVERHRGKIWLESELGLGTTFYFTIQKIERS